MGVHGLWRLLESTGKPINPETLEGKVLAVDISIWLNQAVKGVRDREGNSMQNAHLLTLFNRICKLLFFCIRPVFVFDGDAPLLKKQTLALRRQRKEELNRESKQTNEKLLKTFLKRQAIKAALGDSSKDPLPSLSSVRRDKVEDMYVLPALPAAEEKEKSSSEEEERESDEEVDTYHHAHEGDLYEDPNTVDINSEEFASLPPEMKHEILKDMKEFTKRRRTMYHKPPERSGDFSHYQLAGLLRRNQLNQRLEGVEKEMSQRSAGSAPQLYQQDGDQQSHSVESRRLVSEDSSHYILIKGSKKSLTAPENQPVATLSSGSSLTGYKKRAADRPKPLWRPVCEEEEEEKEEEVQGTSVEDSKPTTSTLSQEDISPPSPRTLKAIHAAMNDSSDEERINQDMKDGNLSPRTQLAIHQALSEDEDGAAKRSIPTELQEDAQRPVTLVVVHSSEEETEPAMTSLLSEKPDVQENPTSPSLHVKDSLFVSSSEDEMEEVIGQRNKALRFAALQQCQENELKAEGEMTKGELKRREPQNSLVFENRDLVQPQSVATSTPNPASISLSAAQGQGNDVVKSESSEESETEEGFIEVSEDEFKEEDEADALVVLGEAPSVEVQRDETAKEEKLEENLTPAAVPGLKEDEEKFKQNEETEQKEESSSAPATCEWEHLDMDELEALEGSLQVEQSHLRERKQQQERMANTVTGQMYLESQELLRLFGLPYLVAPMEAEAQCAALDRADQTNGTITDDSDVWLFGGRHVYKNFFSQDKYVEHYQYSDLHNQLGLDRTKLINLAYLLGSDYTEGVPGVGYVTGMEILNEFPGPGLEPLTEFSKWWMEAQEKKRLVADPRDTKVKKKLRDLKLQPGFPNPAVAQAYLHPAVEQSESSFSWGRPQLDMIKEFCLSRFGWSSRRTEETLQPVMKQLNNKQTQLRIDSFFRMEQQDKQTIRSQRLRRAVACLKRKEEGGEKDDEETHRPSKSKRVKAANKSKKGGDKEKEEETSVAGGGFLGSEVTEKSPLKCLEDVNSTSQESRSVKALPQPSKTLPVGVGSSSSSGEDSDGGGEVATVTARSVFESSRRGRGAKTSRGRNKTGKKGRGKML
ncbi:DNA excision repair protein ERCC-5 [Betta splendens]|uniref:DNA excision repair protein ERCC-5 n=1 Tax=Betta splendens TaxID=158456 RepID=A0A6P7LZC8_BETSP|nr:DNA excision repair protein ERCC-5 [Betta splendens]